MREFELPFSMYFEGDREIISKFDTTNAPAGLKDMIDEGRFNSLVTIDNSSGSIIHGVDLKKNEYEICEQLNRFITFTEKRKKRVDAIEKVKGWLGVSRKELQYFHMRNIVYYFCEHKEYCTSEMLDVICQLLFEDVLLRTHKLNRDYFDGMLDAIPIDNHTLNKIFEDYFTKFQEPVIYQCSHIIDVPLATLDHIFRSGNIIKKCQHCSKIFVSQRANDQYCNGMSPEYTDKTCKEAMKYKKQLERESKNPIHQEYKRTYNALYRRTLTQDFKKQQRAQERLETFMGEAEKKKKQIGEDEYIKWLIMQKSIK